ncbi:N-lysine methyltransferase KMT5A-A-like [Tubulanus polymorphus]|uniref:N-lysine methyltransferase KMT5A-A-like n=1 Tax=Tubulanus polymorphus TaxID=672921 RepID=UPI003DA26144
MDFGDFGVFSLRDLRKGDFVLEYRGECINGEEATKPEKGVDATHTTSAMARMINDATHKLSNCVMKKVSRFGVSHLCLFATNDIDIGDEWRHDYGDGQHLWWREFPNSDEMNPVGSAKHDEDENMDEEIPSVAVR